MSVESIRFSAVMMLKVMKDKKPKFNDKKSLKNPVTKTGPPILGPEKYEDEDKDKDKDRGKDDDEDDNGGGDEDKPLLP